MSNLIERERHEVAASGSSLAANHQSTARFRVVLGALVASLILILGGVSGIGADAASAAQTEKVCTPKKCVTVNANDVCKPGTCDKKLYAEVPAGEYCSPSNGCFTYHGKNWRYVGGPVATPAEQSQARQCMANLGLTVLSGAAGGPAGLTIAGVALSVWGCTS